MCACAVRACACVTYCEWIWNNCGMVYDIWCWLERGIRYEFWQSWQSWRAVAKESPNRLFPARSWREFTAEGANVLMKSVIGKKDNTTDIKQKRAMKQTQERKEQKSREGGKWNDSSDRWKKPESWQRWKNVDNNYQSCRYVSWLDRLLFLVIGLMSWACIFWMSSHFHVIEFCSFSLYRSSIRCLSNKE